MEPLLLIYNPTAGKGQLPDELAAVLDEFTKANWLVTAYPTQGKGDAARAARELGPRFHRVVCAGGDGTLSETVTGLMQLEKPPILGYIPFGSTNDCAANLGLPRIPRQAAAIAAGVYKDYKDAAKHMVRINSRVYPNPDRVEIDSKKFQRYMAVSNALDTVWEKFEV